MCDEIQSGRQAQTMEGTVQKKGVLSRISLHYMARVIITVSSHRGIYRGRFRSSGQTARKKLVTLPYYSIIAPSFILPFVETG